MALGTDFERVINGARDADQECLTLLYRDMNPRLLHYLRIKAPAEADDLASEVWLSVARSIAGFTGDENGFRRWIFTIARHQVIATYRKAGRRNTHATANEDLDAMPAGSDLADAVSDTLAAREMFERLASTLPKEQSEIVLLKIVGGFSAEEIAGIVGKKAGTVRVLLHRALRRLADTVATPPEITAAEA